MDQNIFRDTPRVHHRFRVRDDASTLELTAHLEVHVIELDRWRSHPETPVAPGLLGWLRFFTEAESWSAVPAEIDNPVLESTMAVLTDFQTNAALSDLYRSRLDFIRTQNTMQADRDDAIAAREAALAENARLAAENAALRARLDPFKSWTRTALASLRLARRAGARTERVDRSWRERAHRPRARACVPQAPRKARGIPSVRIHGLMGGEVGDRGVEEAVPVHGDGAR